MTLALRFDPDAAEELATIAAWYESRRAGAGVRFLLEAERILALAIDHPAIGRAWGPPAGARRLGVRDFPVAMRCRVEGDVLRVLAIVHLAARG